eukprot:jgi/Ulvmu1/6249/UM028_0107.1
MCTAPAPSDLVLTPTDARKQSVRHATNHLHYSMHMAQEYHIIEIADLAMHVLYLVLTSTCTSICMPRIANAWKSAEKSQSDNSAVHRISSLNEPLSGMKML